MTISETVVVHADAVIHSFDIEPKPLDRLVDEYFRKHRELNSRTRRAIADVVFNVIRWRLRIEDALNGQGIKKPTREQIVGHYLENAPFDISGMPSKKSLGVVAAHYSLPEWFVKRLIKQRGDEDAYRLMAAFKTEAPVTLRTNTLKSSRDELVATLEKAGQDVQATEYSPYGITLKKRAALAADESFKLGLFEMQDEASQLASMIVAPEPGEIILDACAGAGGKALMLAMLMNDAGTIVAADIDERKLKYLGKRAERAGVQSISIQATKDLERVEKYRGQCDAVLLDVPCSGSGTLRRSPDLAFRLKEDDLEAFAAMQRELLQEYSSWLKPGGRLIYSTCSVLEEENERIVEDFMHSSGFSGLGRECMAKAGIDQKFITPEGYFKALPSKSSMDGFFACVMGKPANR